jgi:PPOX class probable F420-dependent enzyme
MAVSLSTEAKSLIDRPNFAHFATLMPDGSPLSTPVWIGRDGNRIVISLSDGSLKGKNTARDPRVSLSIVDFENPYEELQIRGRVIERRPDPKLMIMDPISHKYTGKPFPREITTAGFMRIALMIEVEKERYTKLSLAHTPPK